MVNHPLEKCTTLEDYITQFAKDGRIMLDLDNTFEKNHISSQTAKSSLASWWDGN